MKGTDAVIIFNGDHYVVEGFHTTELGHLYIRLKSLSENQWINYHIQKNFDPKDNVIIDLIKK